MTEHSDYDNRRFKDAAPCADRIRYTGKHVSRLDCSGQSHSLLTHDFRA
jgi:hypothetical protein